MNIAILVVIYCCTHIRADFANDVLKEHNQIRAMHDAKPLKLNAILSKKATEYAKAMALSAVVESSQQDTYGENLCYTTGNPVSCVKKWYNEINAYDFNEPRVGFQNRHFTQMVWKDTTELGVGIGKSGDMSYVVTRYYPAGNIGNGFIENVKPRNNLTTSSTEKSNA